MPLTARPTLPQIEQPAASPEPPVIDLRTLPEAPPGEPAGS